MGGELAKAICHVMAAAAYIPQTGKNSFHNYSYASDADLLLILQPAMIAAGLALVPHDIDIQTVEHSPDRKGKPVWRSDLVVTWMLIHISGESMIVKAPGCGVDGEDKGAYKAMTGALKYALRHLFLVPTGNDPERTRQAQEVPPVVQGPIEPPEWLLANLEDKGWDRATVKEDLRDFAFFAMAPGKGFDPWALNDERLQGLPAWLAGSTDTLDAWMGWREDIDKLLGGLKLTYLDLGRYRASRKLPKASRLCQADRTLLLEDLRGGGIEGVVDWVNDRRGSVLTRDGVEGVS